MPANSSIRYAIRRKADGLYYKKTRWHTPSWVTSNTQAKLYLSQITAKDVNLGRLCWQEGDYSNPKPWSEHRLELIKRFNKAYEVVPVELTFKEF